MENISTIKPIPEILSYQNEAILNRYMRDFGGSKESASECFLALKQYLVICGISSTATKQSSDSVDQMWHTFILFTKDYRDFCDSYIGRFIDHDPIGGADTEPFSKTLELVKEIFGEVNPKYWSEGCACCSSCTGGGH